MKRWMRHVCGVGAAMILAACGGETTEATDRAPEGADPSAAEPAQASGELSAEEEAKRAEIEEVAMGALEAYRDRDMERLATFGPPGAEDRVIFIEPRNPNYERLLGDKTWRMRALKAWDGEVKGLRANEDVAQVYFAPHPDDDDQVVSIELLHQEGAWRFNDLIEQDKDLYTRSTIRIDMSDLKRAESKAKKTPAGAVEDQPKGDDTP